MGPYVVQWKQEELTQSKSMKVGGSGKYMISGIYEDAVIQMCAIYSS